MKKIMLSLTSVLLISLYACSGNSNPTATTTEIVQQKEVIVDLNVSQFNDLMTTEKGTVLDVRTPEEWAEGTISNAEKMNFYDADFSQQIEALDKTKPVFVYCKKGGRSAGAAEVLRDNGFTKIYNLDGGITAWINEGQEVIK